MRGVEITAPTEIKKLKAKRTLFLWFLRRAALLTLAHKSKSKKPKLIPRKRKSEQAAKK